MIGALFRFIVRHFCFCDHRGNIEIIGEHEGCDRCRCRRCGIEYDYPQR